MIKLYLDTIMGEGVYHNTSKGDQYSYKCRLCNDWKDRLYVSFDKQVYKCHNCEAKGTVVGLLSDVNHISYSEALKIFREYEGERRLPEDIEIEVYNRLIVGTTDELEVPKTAFDLPEEFILLEDAKGEAGRKAVRYIKSRGISLRTAEQNYLGYCEHGQYKNRIIMPDFEKGDLVYWQARTWLPKPKDRIKKKFYRKVLNPSLSEEDKERGLNVYHKSEIISNIDNVLDSGMAIICEGKMDSLKIGPLGACIHGKSMSDTQFIKLVKNKDKIHTIVVMLDGDALQQALDICERLSKHFSDVYIVVLPKDKDPGDLSRSEILSYIEGAELYTPYFTVKARLRGLL
ncbi:DNA primase [Bacillus phage vB_BsuM-Goe19]|nr:DNA primase [Bacillus phage vB_BsuM-Goe19]